MRGYPACKMTGKRLILFLFFLSACGGDDDTPADASSGIDVSAIDATGAADAGAPDARPSGPVEDFGLCSTDLDCMNPSSDCVAIPWIGSDMQCIPRCDVSNDCPFNTFCYPTGGGALGPTF